MKFIAPFHSSGDGREGFCIALQCTSIHYTFKCNTCISLARVLFSGLFLGDRHLAALQAAPLEHLQLTVGAKYHSPALRLSYVDPEAGIGRLRRVSGACSDLSCSCSIPLVMTLFYFQPSCQGLCQSSMTLTPGKAFLIAPMAHRLSYQVHSRKKCPPPPHLIYTSPDKLK